MNTETKQTQRLALPSWRFKPSKLGCLKSNPGEIEFKPLTLVCGPNNTGKTWVMYALYGFLKDYGSVKLPNLAEVTESLVKDGYAKLDFSVWISENTQKIIKSINQATKDHLPSVFNANPKLMRGRFDWSISQEELMEKAINDEINFDLFFGRDDGEILKVSKLAGESSVSMVLRSNAILNVEDILSTVISRHLTGNTSRRNVFLMPAERGGLHLFFRELVSRRTAFFHKIRRGKKISDIFSESSFSANSRYAEPIADYIDWLNDLPDFRGKIPGKYHNIANLVKDVVGGNYDVDAEGVITFIPNIQKIDDEEQESSTKIDFHLTSSTVKSLFGLWAYLEYSAQPGDVLMIDEPELNLHPANQRKLARLLAKLVNSDLRVVVSTHSDYLVREINSLLMLSRPHAARQGLMDKFGYAEGEVLRPEQVAAWLFTDGKIAPMKIDAVEGIHAQTFDDEIHQLNDTSDSIYYAYQDDSESGA